MTIEKVTQEKLSALKGKSLRLWSYTPTKDMLTFMIPGEEEKYLIYLLCQSIKTIPVWIVECPTLTVNESGLIKIEDRDFEIVCREVIFNDEYFGQRNE